MLIDILRTKCFKKSGFSMMYLPLWVMILIGTSDVTSGARIFMVSMQFGSAIHEQVVLGEELVSRGHEVYVALGSRYPRRQDIEKRGMKTLQFKVPDDALYGVSEEMEQEMGKIALVPPVEKGTGTIKIMRSICSHDIEYMMKDEKFINEVKQLNFNLAIIKYASGYLILPKYLNIPFIYFPFYQLWPIRNPALPSFIPMMDAWTEPSDITFWTKLDNLNLYLARDGFSKLMFPEHTSMLHRYAPDVQTWEDLILQADLFFYEVDQYFTLPIPQMPNCISAAGLSTSKAKKLPEGLYNVMEQSVDGVIFLSFGSSASYFPDDIIVKFLDAFANLSQTVIAKFVIPKNVKIPENVKVLSWLPQNDILAHPKTKLFITHCGIHGIYETLYHGVPIIGMPLFIEQHINIRRAVKKGFGLEMSILNFTSAELVSNIQEVLNNPKYRMTIRKASEIFRDQPMHPKERTVFWIEHLIRHGGKHLRTLAMDMPLYEFLMLDVIGILVLGIFALLIALRLLLKCMWKLCFSAKAEHKQKLKSN